MLSKVLIGLLLACTLVQILDVVVHVVTHQIEIDRILGSCAILLWAIFSIACVYGAFPMLSKVPILVGLAATVLMTYLVLNIVFLAHEGLSNDGKPRVVFFVFVLITLGLGACSGVVQVRRTLTGEDGHKEGAPSSSTMIGTPS
eukprot:TRINITY_DN1479_c0_g4_i1.p1 TRINITY_DN1479_c0_g4~~TRINITY_DN1479_c0_g4_i1.p1  ORF type:complete len:157 (+),score=19.19 TRINITY_DN1479_c0_g4_i1:40-471(+)